MAIAIKVTHAEIREDAPNALVMARYKNSPAAYQSAVLAPDASGLFGIHAESELVIRETEEPANVFAVTPKQRKPTTKKKVVAKKKAPAKKKAAPKKQTKK